MDLVLEVVDSKSPHDDLEDLAATVRRDRDLRGCRVTPRLTPPADGAMSSLVDALTIAIGSGGVVVPLVQLLTAWLGSRGTDVSLKMSNGDRSVELDLRRVRDRTAVDELIRQARELVGDAAQS
jgi:hypothetical protein